MSIPQQSTDRIYSREALEKDRLLQRRGTYERYYGGIRAPFAISQRSAIYQPCDVRLQRTPAVEVLKHNQQVQRKAEEVKRIHRGEEMWQRENTRWQSMEQERQRNVERETAMRQEGIKAKRNSSSVPYNLVTLNYGTSVEVGYSGMPVCLPV